MEGERKRKRGKEEIYEREKKGLRKEGRERERRKDGEELQERKKKEKDYKREKGGRKEEGIEGKIREAFQPQPQATDVLAVLLASKHPHVSTPKIFLPEFQDPPPGPLFLMSLFL